MSHKFQASVQHRGDVSYVKLGGVIDEDNELGDLTDKIPSGTAVIDLGEIERICDHLVAIEAGRLLRADTITSFTQASQVLAVEVEEGLTQLQRELEAHGLTATAQQRVLLVPLGGDDTYDVVRDCVAALALPLCRLEQRRHQVEELFRDEEGAPSV